MSYPFDSSHKQVYQDGDWVVLYSSGHYYLYYKERFAAEMSDGPDGLDKYYSGKFEIWISKFLDRKKKTYRDIITRAVKTINEAEEEANWFNLNL